MCCGNCKNCNRYCQTQSDEPIILYSITTEIGRITMNVELSEQEKEFLTMLFKIGETIIENSSEVCVSNYDIFDRNNLYDLALKLDIKY